MTCRSEAAKRYAEVKGETAVDPVKMQAAAREGAKNTLANAISSCRRAAAGNSTLKAMCADPAQNTEAKADLKRQMGRTDISDVEFKTFVLEGAAGQVGDTMSSCEADLATCKAAAKEAPAVAAGILIQPRCVLG